MSLTTIILTHNNQATIRRCLASAKFSDELIIIDDFSTDNTLKIASKFSVTVFQRQLSSWADQRNFGLSKASTDWVLFLDSDEVIPSKLQKQILTAIHDPSVNGYFLKRQDTFLGRTLHHGETSKVRLLRLFQTKKGHWHSPVHEFAKVSGRTNTLSSPLHHLRELSITDFVTRLNHYTDLVASELKSKGQPFSYLDLGKPIFKFFYNYIYLLGFLDGFPGLIFASLMSLHSLSVRIKHWQNTHAS